MVRKRPRLMTYTTVAEERTAKQMAALRPIQSEAMNKTNNGARSRNQGDILQTPEVNVAIFSFLLNFVWEIWQAPFFAGMLDASH
jgi:hypothetical protein